MTERRSLSPTKRLALFEKHRGICHLCEQRIQVGQPWEVEHVRALALNGADDESNMRPAHKGCHATKTNADVARIAKAKRVRAKHIGAKRPSGFRKLPPGYGRDWKQGGRVVKLEKRT